MPQTTFATSGVDLVGQTIDNGRLEFISVLGVGAYGVVYLAIDLHAPIPVYLAVKVLLRTGLDARQRHFQRREIALHQLASRHTGVVTLHKVIEEGDLTFVVMDFYDEGDLFGMITERQRYLGRDDLIRKVFLQIIDAVEYCHMMGIFHRDLKPENILVTRGGEKVCIADFGLATSERTSADFGCGSTFYLSPECQGGSRSHLDHYSTEHNDLWSLGVILVNLTCGRNPWRQACPTDETFNAFMHNPDFLRTILPISHGTNHILKGLFSLDPAQRTSLRRLRREVMMVETFTMTDEELSVAHSAARAAAQAVRGTIPPKAAKVPVPVVAPVPAAGPVPVQAVPVPVPVVVKPVARPVQALPPISTIAPIPQYKPTPQHVEHHQHQHSYRGRPTPQRRRIQASSSGSSSGSSLAEFPDFDIHIQDHTHHRRAHVHGNQGLEVDVTDFDEPLQSSPTHTQRTFASPAFEERFAFTRPETDHKVAPPHTPPSSYARQAKVHLGVPSSLKRRAHVSVSTSRSSASDCGSDSGSGSASGSEGACQPVTPTYAHVRSSHWGGRAPQYGKCAGEAPAFADAQYARKGVRVAPVSPAYGEEYQQDCY